MNRITFKKIPRINNFFADNRGRIWKNKKGRLSLQTTFVDANGYQRVHIPINNKMDYKHFYVQRLVCSAFKGIPTSSKPLCLRRAPNQQPRRVRYNKYLKWGTYQQIKRNKYERVGLKTAITIREKYRSGKYTQIELAKQYFISQSNISFIINNKTYKQYGIKGIC